MVARDVLEVLREESSSQGYSLTEQGASHLELVLYSNWYKLVNKKNLDRVALLVTDPPSANSTTRQNPPNCNTHFTLP